MLAKIRLANFKSWRELDLDLAPLTILFGANSSGKTGVLDALLLLKQTAASFDRRQPINFGGSPQDFVDLGGYQDVVFNHDTEQRINIGLEWVSDKIPGFVTNENLHDGQTNQITELSYEVRWRQLSNRVIIERLNYDVISPSDPELYFRLERQRDDRYAVHAPPGLRAGSGRPAFLPAPESCYGIPREVSRSFSDFDPLEFNVQFEALMDRIFYLGPLRNYPQRAYLWTGTAPQEIGPKGENTIEALIADERRRPKTSRRRKPYPPSLLEKVSQWLSKMGLVRAFQIEAIDEAQRYYETRVKVETESIGSSLIDVGFGVSQVLPVITILFFVPEGSIVLLEQPEIHLHPGAQAHLADLFLKVAEARKLQLIVESHSEHLLTRLQRRVAEAEAEFPLATPEKVRMYFCQYGAEGSSKENVEMDNFGQIDNWPKGFFGDLSGDLDAATDAALKRRRRELAGG